MSKQVTDLGEWGTPRSTSLEVYSCRRSWQCSGRVKLTMRRSSCRGGRLKNILDGPVIQAYSNY